jgi:hypothetical protein
MREKQETTIGESMNTKPQRNDTHTHTNVKSNSTNTNKETQKEKQKVPLEK